MKSNELEKELIRILNLRWKIGVFALSAVVSVSGLLPSSAAAIEGLDPKLDPKGYPTAVVRWEFNNIEANISTSPVIVSDGTIYVGADNKKLYAINPDGTKKWETLLGAAPYGTPVIGSDGTIYVNVMDNSTSTHKLYAIDPIGRKVKWEFIRGGNSIKALEVFSSPAIGGDGTIFAGGSDNRRLYAINPDGKPKWDYITEGATVFSPAVGSDGTIYVGATGGNLYAIKPNGVKKWTFSTQPIVASPLIGSEGSIYAGSYTINKGAAFYAINPDGTNKWTTNDFRSLSAPGAGADGTYYIAFDKKLVAENPIGTRKWFLDIGNNVKLIKTPVTADENMIYAASDNNVLYAIDTIGKVKWGYVADGIGDKIPAAGSDGTVYVAGRKILYALGTVAASSVSLNKKTLNLQAGDSEALTASIVPEKATNKQVKWSSSDSAVAAVDSTGKVTGIAAGTAKITVKAEDGGFIADCTVTVSGIPGSKLPARDTSVTSNFSDISGHWASVEIAKAVDLGFVNGYADGTFRPNASVTRAEFTAMLIRGLKPVVEGTTLAFEDKDEIGVWAVQPVAQAVQLRIISGYEDGTFRPNANITHAEMIAMVIRSSGLPAGKASKTNYADEADIPDWAKIAVSTAEETGIIIVGGITDKKFAPQVLSTRAEAASAIVRMLKVRK
ncbi:PQQ-binding-like beta-propeller repeat protein [Paenibacillus radicis (ex Xue et al. 2023)]|uniref:PQQ-binding-like beta-propeller repeat protein n=1 Tax=Paenibacillus radicis (ex Xue et al. 2023) TaxID=2972489 RepID=A0ABT1YDM0_9BACL|nr:PQQ-binding-like beta-propeller repeat protein [Paenibacillus radicis (ex Xue et al. 2023)]MCR8630313.1 PQQ-binding-like beta-propeller repeat protein [Paenibacillus radicis (ex Xue et al. 2023)]